MRAVDDESMRSRHATAVVRVRKRSRELSRRPIASGTAVATTNVGAAAVGAPAASDVVVGPANVANGATTSVTEEMIRTAMKNAPLVSQQAGGVSLPRVQDYVSRLAAGETPPAIKVDGSIIVDGNHRYVAGRVFGQDPPIQPWSGGRPGAVVPWDQIPIDFEAW
jgi:hypothetical protein